MKRATATKQLRQATTQATEQGTITTEIDKLIIGAVVAFTGIIALWSVVCLFSAMFQAGGPLQLAGGYFKALMG